MAEVTELMVEISREEYERLKRMEDNLFPVTEPAIMDTGPNGLIEVTAMYVSAELGAPKIFKLANGGYCYESGFPIDRRKALDIIPPGRDRDDALYWFDTKDEKSTTAQQGITVRPDLTLQFEDGTPVTSIAQITQAIKPGMHQEWLIRCFMQQEEKKAKAPTEIPEWMVKQEEKPKMAATKPKPKPKAKPKPKGRPRAVRPIGGEPATPPPLSVEEAPQEIMAE